MRFMNHDEQELVRKLLRLAKGDALKVSNTINEVRDARGDSDLLKVVERLYEWRTDQDRQAQDTDEPVGKQDQETTPSS